MESKTKDLSRLDHIRITNPKFIYQDENLIGHTMMVVEVKDGFALCQSVFDYNISNVGVFDGDFMLIERPKIYDRATA